MQYCSAHMLIQCSVTCVGFRHVLKKTLSTWLTILIYPIYQKRFDGLTFKVSCIVVWFLYATDLYIFSTHGTVHVLLIANAMLSPEKNNILPTDVSEEKRTPEKEKQRLLLLSLVANLPNWTRYRVIHQLLHHRKTKALIVDQLYCRARVA